MTRNPKKCKLFYSVSIVYYSKTTMADNQLLFCISEKVAVPEKETAVHPVVLRVSLLDLTRLSKIIA